MLVGPVGPVCKGHVLDVSRKPFERALRDLDPLLYVKWNPQKLQKHGCWEIRRRPDINSILDIVDWRGMSILNLEPVELPMVNHILDCAFLNYDQIRKLKGMDTWAHGNTAQDGAKKWLDKLDDLELQNSRDAAKKANEARSYAARHYKKELRAFKEAVRDGVNPGIIGKYWNQGSDL